jgi:HTH-type transcriptional repressor of NAD biosynthesis genes
MKTGLILGKFMPVHKGHLQMIHFAQQHCDQLHVMICASNKETIEGSLRLKWLQESLHLESNLQIDLLEYDEAELPNTSVSNMDVSRKWAAVIAQKYHGLDLFFSSEQYGDYVAEILGIRHICFDAERVQVPVSATLIRNKPFQYWNFIPETVRPYFVKKVVLLGSESTGKSTLTEKLAQHYQTLFVPEMAREIVEETESCSFEDLHAIAALQAGTILEKTPLANKILFIDTDINITKSYARFLFNKELETEAWINNANQFDLYLYLETDCPFVQDGTRLNEAERNRLNDFHKAQLKRNQIAFSSIAGNWLERFEQAVKLIDQLYF